MPFKLKKKDINHSLSTQKHFNFVGNLFFLLIFKIFPKFEKYN